MNLNIRLIKFNKTYDSVFKPDYRVNFKGINSLSQDMFEKENTHSQDNKKTDNIPVSTGIIWDKKLNKPVNVCVLKSVTGQYETTYRFVSKNRKKEYGYVNLTLCKIPKNFESVYWGGDECLLKNYSECGIKGARVIVDYLENYNDSAYSGIGNLADKITVKHCLDNNIKPVVVSIADWGSHVAHYKRGKRFLPLTPDTKVYRFFMEKYGSSDVNGILKKLVKESEEKGEKIDISGWYPIPVYLPKELAQKYAIELKSEKKK